MFTEKLRGLSDILKKLCVITAPAVLGIATLLSAEAQSGFDLRPVSYRRASDGLILTGFSAENLPGEQIPFTGTVKYGRPIGNDEWKGSTTHTCIEGDFYPHGSEDTEFQIVGKFRCAGGPYAELNRVDGEGIEDSDLVTITIVLEDGTQVQWEVHANEAPLVTSTPTSTNTATATDTSTPTDSPTPIATDTATPTPTSTVTPTFTPPPTWTRPAPTATGTSTATSTVIPTIEQTATLAPTPMDTLTATPQPTTVIPRCEEEECQFLPLAVNNP